MEQTQIRCANDLRFKGTKEWCEMQLQKTTKMPITLSYGGMYVNGHKYESNTMHIESDADFLCYFIAFEKSDITSIQEYATPEQAKAFKRREYKPKTDILC